MDQRDKICETAFGMFLQTGYSGVTTEQIARRCGVGKATLYKHFSSKEALILGCVDYYTSRISAEIEEIVANPELTPQQKITGFIAPVVRFVSGISPGVLGDIRRNVPEAYEKIDQNRRRIIGNVFARILREGKESGIFRADLNDLLVTHLIIGAVTHLCSPRVLGELGLSGGELLNETLSTIWEGCLSEKGRELSRREASRGSLRPSGRI